MVIKDSWVDVNRPKEGDTLSETLDDASDDEKAMFLTVLIHGVVTIDGREDLTQDLLLNGYLVSTDDDSPKSNNRGDSIDALDELRKIVANVAIAGHVRAKNTAQGDHICKASIFEVLRTSKPGSQPSTLITSPDVSTSDKEKRQPRVYGPKAHYSIVFEERGQSLHSMSCQRQIKLPLVVQAMHDILKGS